jgi:membrane protease YdiL (CAAX protease family)
MLIQWICLVFFLVYFAVQIATNLLLYQKIIDAIHSGRLKRMQLYLRLALGLWIPALLLLAPAAFGVFSLNDLGIGRRDFGCPAWLFGVSCAMALIYFGYLLYSFAALRARYLKGEARGQGIPEKMKPMLPASPREKAAWAGVSVLIGVGEEFLFRGFLFYILLALFPALPLAAVLAVSSVIFGAGHLYQGPKEAVKPLVIGALFGVFYLSFGTIWPCVVLHALQDACAAYAL